MFIPKLPALYRGRNHPISPYGLRTIEQGKLEHTAILTQSEMIIVSVEYHK